MADVADDADECAICLLSGPALTTPLRVTHCGHAFCSGCLGSYVIKRPAGSPSVACPMCRASLPDWDLPQMLPLSVSRSALIDLTLAAGDEMPGLRIARVTPRSDAAAAGLRRGMRLLSVRSEPCQAGFSLSAALARSVDDEPIKIEISHLTPAVEPSTTSARQRPRANTLNPCGVGTCGLEPWPTLRPRRHGSFAEGRRRFIARARRHRRACAAAASSLSCGSG